MQNLGETMKDVMGDFTALYEEVLSGTHGPIPVPPEDFDEVEPVFSSKWEVGARVQVRRGNIGCYSWYAGLCYIVKDAGDDCFLVQIKYGPVERVCKRNEGTVRLEREAPSDSPADYPADPAPPLDSARKAALLADRERFVQALGADSARQVDEEELTAAEIEELLAADATLVGAPGAYSVLVDRGEFRLAQMALETGLVTKAEALGKLGTEAAARLALRHFGGELLQYADVNVSGYAMLASVSASEDYPVFLEILAGKADPRVVLPLDYPPPKVKASMAYILADDERIRQAVYSYCGSSVEGFLFTEETFRQALAIRPEIAELSDLLISCNYGCKWLVPVLAETGRCSLFEQANAYARCANNGDIDDLVSIITHFGTGCLTDPAVPALVDCEDLQAWHDFLAATAYCSQKKSFTAFIAGGGTVSAWIAMKEQEAKEEEEEQQRIADAVAALNARMAEADDAEEADAGAVYADDADAQVTETDGAEMPPTPPTDDEEVMAKIADLERDGRLSWVSQYPEFLAAWAGLADLSSASRRHFLLHFLQAIPGVYDTHTWPSDVVFDGVLAEDAPERRFVRGAASHIYFMLLSDDQREERDFFLAYLLCASLRCFDAEDADELALCFERIPACFKDASGRRLAAADEVVRIVSCVFLQGVPKYHFGGIYLSVPAHVVERMPEGVVGTATWLSKYACHPSRRNIEVGDVIRISYTWWEECTVLVTAVNDDEGTLDVRYLGHESLLEEAGVNASERVKSTEIMTDVLPALDLTPALTDANLVSLLDSAELEVADSRSAKLLRRYMECLPERCVAQDWLPKTLQAAGFPEGKSMHPVFACLPAAFKTAFNFRALVLDGKDLEGGPLIGEIFSASALFDAELDLQALVEDAALLDALVNWPGDQSGSNWDYYQFDSVSGSLLASLYARLPAHLQKDLALCTRMLSRLTPRSSSPSGLSKPCDLFEAFSEEVRADAELCRLALAADAESYRSMSEEAKLVLGEDGAKTALEGSGYCNGCSLSEVPAALVTKELVEWVFATARYIDGTATDLQYVPASLVTPDIVKAAVGQNAKNLSFAPADMRGSKELILAAMSAGPDVFLDSLEYGYTIQTRNGNVYKQQALASLRPPFAEFPPTVSTPDLHPHELTLAAQSRYAGGGFSCDFCAAPAGVEGWCYSCESCGFDVHPTCCFGDIGHVPADLAPFPPTTALPLAVGSRCLYHEAGDYRPITDDNEHHCVVEAYHGDMTDLPILKDREVLEALVTNTTSFEDGKVYAALSPELFDDESFCRIIAGNGAICSLFPRLSPRLKVDPEFYTAYFDTQYDSDVMRKVLRESPELCDSEDVIEALCGKTAYPNMADAITFASPRVQLLRKDLWLKGLHADSDDHQDALVRACPERAWIDDSLPTWFRLKLRNNSREQVLFKVRMGCSLEGASDETKDDEEIVRIACTIRPGEFQNASDVSVFLLQPFSCSFSPSSTHLFPPSSSPPLQRLRYDADMACFVSSLCTADN